MALFRKKETLNEQLLREAGLDRVVFNTPPSAPIDAGPLPGTTGDIRVGPGEQRRGGSWDTTMTVTTAGVEGDLVRFTTLPNGDVIVSAEDGDGDLAPFADAIEEHVSPPYTAEASRQDGDLWGVGARRIDVEEFAFADGEAVELSQRDGVVEYRIDGEVSDATPPAALQRLGEQAGPDFCVEAARIDGDFWEVMVNPL